MVKRVCIMDYGTLNWCIVTYEKQHVGLIPIVLLTQQSCHSGSLTNLQADYFDAFPEFAFLRLPSVISQAAFNASNKTAMTAISIYGFTLFLTTKKTCHNYVLWYR